MKAGAKATPMAGAAAADEPRAFHLEDYLPYQLTVAAARVSRLMSHRYAAAFGLTIPEWRVLATIARFGCVSPSVVGEWTAMDKVKVSRAAAGLVARGLVRQTTDPRDGRGRLLRMTRKGRSVYDGAVPLAREMEAALAEAVGRNQWTALSKALVRLNAQVERMDGALDA